MKSTPPFALRLIGCAALLAISACSTLSGDKLDYKSQSNVKTPTLDVPPDLTQLSRDSRYAIPGGPVSANALKGVPATPSSAIAAPSMGDARIERAGNQRWLVINRPADQLWGPVRDFWQENGFLLTQDQAELGIMETDWAENRAKLPQDIIRGTLGKLLDGLYSTGERDKFRTRLERGTTGGTEIFISHRGMVETYTSTVKDQTIWQPRPADVELETEFLRRLMVKLGAPVEQAKAQNPAAPKPAARVAAVNNLPVVQLDEDFDRAWRRVGLALDRTGFTVEDRDRNQGTYFVRYVEPSADKSEKGFLGRLFSVTSTPGTPLKYRITVRSQAQSTTVSVLDASGKPETSATSQRIVQVLADELK